MKLTQRFGPIPVTTTLDGSGNGTVTFQPNGSNARITNLFVKVSTATNQAVCTIYKGQIADGNAINTTNSGSTGAPATGAIDLTDGETLYVRWTGGDAGATATATFSGITIPFDQVGPSALEWADPIAAGDGSLVYPALKSPNYLAGIAGWKIDRDGNAEFNDIDVRGNGIFGNPAGERLELTDAGDLEIYDSSNVLIATIDESGIKFYDSGDVVAWIDNFAVTFQDTFGNSIDVTTDPAFGALILFNTEDPVGLVISPGRAYATTFPAQDDAPVLVLQSPYQSSPSVRNYARIYIIGEDSAANPAKIDFRTGGGPVSVLDGADLIVEGDLSVAGVGYQSTKVKANTEDRANVTTVANDGELTNIALGVGTYSVEVLIFATTPTTNTQKLKTQWGFTGTWNNPIRACVGPGSTNTAARSDITPSQFNGVPAGTDVTYGFAASTGFNVVMERADNVTVTVAGTLSLKWSQAAASANVTSVKAGSSVTVRRIA